MNSDAKLIKTKDGSDTIFLSNLNEHYHSIHGALQESEHVYIKSGLNFFSKMNPTTLKINVFEVGMGTGLNVLLTLYWALENEIHVNLTTIEPFPLNWDLLKNYNYGLISEKDNFNQYVEQLHTSEWGKLIFFHPYFSFTKLQVPLEHVEKNLSGFNVLYFDAFAPNKQEKMWNSDNLFKVYSVLDYEGVLVTYCAKGAVRRSLQEVGFEVQRIEGPPGKREMLRALKLT